MMLPGCPYCLPVTRRALKPGFSATVRPVVTSTRTTLVSIAVHVNVLVHRVDPPKVDSRVEARANRNRGVPQPQVDPELRARFLSGGECARGTQNEAETRQPAGDEVRSAASRTFGNARGPCAPRGDTSHQRKGMTFRPAAATCRVYRTRHLRADVLVEVVFSPVTSGSVYYWQERKCI